MKKLEAELATPVLIRLLVHTQRRGGGVFSLRDDWEITFSADFRYFPRMAMNGCRMKNFEGNNNFRGNNKTFEGNNKFRGKIITKKASQIEDNNKKNRGK